MATLHKRVTADRDAPATALYAAVVATAIDDARSGGRHSAEARDYLRGDLCRHHLSWLGIENKQTELIRILDPEEK